MTTALPTGVRQHLLGLRHIGIVTADAETLLARFKQLFGLKDDEIVRVPQADQVSDSRFAFFSVGGVPYEVIEPVSEALRKQLLSRPAGINHVCYNVDDLDAAVAVMQDNGVHLGHVTPGGILEMPHARMAYFNPDDTADLLVEFVEQRK